MCGKDRKKIETILSFTEKSSERVRILIKVLYLCGT